MDKDLKELLVSDKRKNIAALGFFANYKADEILTEGNSAIIIGKSDNLWAHIISGSEVELTSLLKKVQGRVKYYYSVDDWMIPLILRNGSQDWIMSTNRFVLDENVIVPKPSIDSRTIDLDYANYILDNSEYKEFLSTEYIVDRLERDVSAGIHIDNKLIAWGFTHDDGALGFLNVLKYHRKRGYATEVMLGLINMKRKEGEDVFGNILTNNVASVKMVTKIGFGLDCKTSWIKLK